MIGKTRQKALSYGILLLLFMGLLPVVSARLLYVGPTEKGEAGIIESAAVDSDTPNEPTASLGAASRGKYTFVKIDLSKLPPINEIYIVRAYLGFGFGSWHGSGAGGYASVATHYCDDDSWSKSTLTWNNKPTHRQQSSDHWGFSIIYYGSPNLGFNIEDDVEETLKAGDMVLTEVVTWGSGTGSTSLSSPSIKIEYAKRPIYTVAVTATSDAPEIDLAKEGLAKVQVSQQTLQTWVQGEARIADFCAAPGTYSLAFTGRCKFLGWGASGGASVANPNAALTDITINSDGNLELQCSLEWVQYGDEDKPSYTPPEEGIAMNASQRYAEKHEVIVPGFLRKVRLYIVKDPMPFELHVLGPSDNPASEPPAEIAPVIKVSSTRSGWVELDLTQHKIEVDGEFYVSITWLHDGWPAFDDAWGPSGDVYVFKEAKWERHYDDILIQLIVSRTLEEPVEFITTTTTTKITTTTTPTTRVETTETTVHPTTVETTVTPTETTTARTTTPGPSPIPGIDALGFQILIGFIVVLVVAVVIGVAIRKRRKPQPPSYMPPPAPPPAPLPPI